MKPIPELLAPSGNAEIAKVALSCGADAVYLGLKKWSARAGAFNLTFDELSETAKFAHSLGKRVYVTINTLLYSDELDDATEMAIKADQCGADAFIVQDLGLARRLLALRDAGNISGEIHASTQMSVGNTEGLREISEMGFDRLITPRELHINELSELCQHSPIPVECFAHGALCISYSGQCLLSSYIGGRSGNRGECAQACRMKYLKDGEWSYRLSPSDYSSLSILDKLVDTGVASLKIEGRLKSAEFVAAVVSAYRRALDSIAQGCFDSYLSNDYPRDIENIKIAFSRGEFSTGFLAGNITSREMTYSNPGRKGALVGVPASEPVFSKIRTKSGSFVNICKICVLSSREIKPGDGVTFYDEEMSPMLGGNVDAVEFNNGKYFLTISGEMVKPLPRGTQIASIKLGITASKELEANAKSALNKIQDSALAKVTVSVNANPSEPLTFTICDALGNKVTAQSSHKLTPEVQFIGGNASKVSDNKTNKKQNNIDLNGKIADMSDAASMADADEIDKKIDKIREAAGKLGGTPFKVASSDGITLCISREIYVPFVWINRLRRIAADKLCEIKKSQKPAVVRKNGPATALLELDVLNPDSMPVVVSDANPSLLQNKEISSFNLSNIFGAYSKLEEAKSICENSNHAESKSICENSIKETSRTSNKADIQVSNYFYNISDAIEFYSSKTSDTNFKEDISSETLNKNRNNTISLCYVPYDSPANYVETLSKLVHKAGGLLLLSLPFINLGAERSKLQKIISEYETGARDFNLIDGFELSLIGDFEFIHNLPLDGKIIAIDNSYNIYNEESAMFVRKYLTEQKHFTGEIILTISPEAARRGVTLPKIDGISWEIIQSGPIPLMRSRHCFLSSGRTNCGECHSPSDTTIKDTFGAVYDILTKRGDCQSILLSTNNGGSGANGFGVSSETNAQGAIFRVNH